MRESAASGGIARAGKRWLIVRLGNRSEQKLPVFRGVAIETSPFHS